MSQPYLGQDAPQNHSRGYLLEIESEENLPTSSDVKVVRRTYRVKSPSAIMDAPLENAHTGDTQFVQSFKFLQSRIEHELADLKSQNTDIGQLKNIQTQFAELTKLVETSLKERDDRPSIDPKIQVVQPVIRYVDANLAHRFADLQGDANFLIGFASLALGAFLSFIVSWLIASLSATQDQLAINIYLTASILSLFFGIILGILAFRAVKKSIESRATLEAGVVSEE